MSPSVRPLSSTPAQPSLLTKQRQSRLTEVMSLRNVPALLSADPFTVRYATGTRNMLVHGLTGPDRLVLVLEGGPTVLWEFAGCEHLWAGHDGFDEMREAPALSAKKSPHFRAEAAEFAAEVAALVVTNVGPTAPLAVERLDAPVTDALRSAGIDVVDATEVVQQAMAIKQPAEITAMQTAVTMTEAATAALEEAIAPGRTEQELWAEFQRALLAEGGELVVARLLQSGARTFPYFQEASGHVTSAGDLICFDTDAVGLHGYSVDFSRTFLCGETEPTPRQRELYRLAREQLMHNAANLSPGRSFESFARAAFDVPEPFRAYGYYQLAHGLGLAGGHPNVPRFDGGTYGLPGDIEPGMVLCVESYIGDPETRQGVKLEDQFLIGPDSVTPMSTYPFDPRLS